MTGNQYCQSARSLESRPPLPLSLKGLHCLTREFRVKLHAKTDIALIASRFVRYRFQVQFNAESTILQNIFVYQLGWWLTIIKQNIQQSIEICQRRAEFNNCFITRLPSLFSYFNHFLAAQGNDLPFFSRERGSNCAWAEYLHWVKHF